MFVLVAAAACLAIPPESPNTSPPAIAAADNVGSTPTPAPTVPLTSAKQPPASIIADVTIAPGECTVRVYSHAIATRSGIVPLWVFVSDGLARHGQEEVALAIRRGVGEETNYPRDVFTLYHTLFTLAADDRRVLHSEMSLLGPDFHLLGVPDLRGVLYAPGQRIVGVPLPEKFLTALLVTKEEYQVIARYGDVRFLAHLGDESGVHPYPPWTDPQRVPTTRAAMGLSVLATPVPRVASAGLVVALEPPAGASEIRLEGRVILRIAPEALGAIDDMLANLPLDMPVALLADFDPTADAVFTYNAKATAPTALSCDTARASQILADFLIIVPGQGSDEALTMKEDGFVLKISAATWTALREAMAKRAPYSKHLAELDFAIEWPGARPNQPFDSWCIAREGAN